MPSYGTITTGTWDNADTSGSWPQDAESSGSFVAQADEIEWSVLRPLEEHPSTQIADFLEYVDEDCPCPTRRETDKRTAVLAQRIYYGLRDIYGQPMRDHRDMIFGHAQEIIRTIGPPARPEYPANDEGQVEI